MTGVPMGWWVFQVFTWPMSLVRSGVFMVSKVVRLPQKDLPLAPTLNTQDWSACLYTFYTQGLLEMVEDRRGNLPAVYRLKTKNLTPPPSGKVSDFPLQEMVMGAIAGITQRSFGRKEVYAKVLEMNPEHTDRIAMDSVSAVLNRVSKLKDSPVRTIATGPSGNLYTHAGTPS